jgi:hypothetical protein
MERVIDDIKEKRYNTVEYPFSNDSSVKLVESLPASTEKPLQRTEALAFDELNVRTLGWLYADLLVKEKGHGSIQKEI